VISLKQAVDLFVIDGMPARNLSPQTRKVYRHDLVDLLAFLKDGGASTLSDISLRYLEAYQAEMEGGKYSVSTRNRETHRIQPGAAYAVHSVLNLNVAESLLLGCQPVIVEGATDQHYLISIK
jgi:site-specific recombinase XerD